MTRRKHKPVAKPQAAEAAARPQAAASAAERLRPWLLGGMTALFIARPLFPSEAAATHGDGLTVVMLWIALGVFWMLGAIGRPKLAVRFGATDAAVALLLLCFTVAALWAVKHGSPRPAVNVLWEWIGMGLSFFLARQLIATPREARAVAAVMVALAVAVSAYGLYQWAYEMPRTLATYDADPDGELQKAGLSYPPDSPERKLFRDRLASNLPAGTFALSNSLAAFLAPWLVVLAGVAWSSVRNRKRLVGIIVCAILIAACLVLTYSRSGCIAAGVGLMLVWLLVWRPSFQPGWRAVAVVAVLLAAAAVVGTLQRDRLALASKSFGYRLQYWQSSLEMIADHPWLGCGPGNFQDAYTRYKLPEASEEIADPHNFLLEIWATAGTPAMLAFLAVLGCFVRGQRSEIRGQRSEVSLPPSPFPPVPSSDGWPHVLVGGGIGFLLSVPLGMLSAAPPGAIEVLPELPGVFPGLRLPVAVLLLPMAAAAVAVLLGWIRAGQMPRWLPAVGVAVLLFALLTSGGIGLPGVAGTFWLLLCLGLGGQETGFGGLGTSVPSGGQGSAFRVQDSVWTCPGWAGWAGLAAAIALAAACYGTAYNPVLTCQAHLRLSERMTDRAVEQLEAAAAADPRSAEPWQRLAGVWFDVWRQGANLVARSGDRATTGGDRATTGGDRATTGGDRAAMGVAFERFEQADAKVLRLAPNSAPARLNSGDWYFEAASKTDRQGTKLVPDAMGKAVAAYENAVELYPNNALYRAKLAEAYRVAGEPSAFRREAEAALRLDELTPHLDKKLPTKLRTRLLHGLGGK